MFSLCRDLPKLSSVFGDCHQGCELLFRGMDPKNFIESVSEFKICFDFFHCNAIKNHSCDGTLKLEILIKVKFSVEDNERTFFGRTTHRWVRATPARRLGCLPKRDMDGGQGLFETVGLRTF